MNYYYYIDGLIAFVLGIGVRYYFTRSILNEVLSRLSIFTDRTETKIYRECQEQHAVILTDILAHLDSFKDKSEVKIRRESQIFANKLRGQL